MTERWGMVIDVNQGGTRALMHINVHSANSEHH